MARARTYPDDLRARLVAAAGERLLCATPEQFSLRELAASQKTTTNAIYSIFGGKQALLRAVIDEAHDTFIARQLEAMGNGPSLEGLHRLGTAFREWALAHPSLYRLMFGDALGLAPDAVAADAKAPLLRMVSDLVEAGILRDAPVDIICRGIWATTHGFVLMELAERPDPDVASAEYESIQRLFLRGLLTDQAREAFDSAE